MVDRNYDGIVAMSDLHISSNAPPQHQAPKNNSIKQTLKDMIVLFKSLCQPIYDFGYDVDHQYCAPLKPTEGGLKSCIKKKKKLRSRIDDRVYNINCQLKDLNRDVKLYRKANYQLHLYNDSLVKYTKKQQLIIAERNNLAKLRGQMFNESWDPSCMNDVIPSIDDISSYEDN